MQALSASLHSQTLRNERRYMMIKEETHVVVEYVKKCVNQTLEQLKQRLYIYESDINLAYDDEECRGCNDNVFKSIYRMIDDMKED